MIASTLTGAQLVRWRKRHGWARPFAAKRLGLSTSCMGNYERGKRSTGQKTAVPFVVTLAMAAIDAGLKPISAKNFQGDVI